MLIFIFLIIMTGLIIKLIIKTIISIKIWIQIIINFIELILLIATFIFMSEIIIIFKTNIKILNRTILNLLLCKKWVHITSITHIFQLWYKRRHYSFINVIIPIYILKEHVLFYVLNIIKSIILVFY